MKVESSELVGLIRKNLKMLEKLHSSMEKVYREDLELLGKTDRSALMVAGISEENYPRLLELLKFRHFRGYYFELEYDWDRLEYLRKNFNEAHPPVTEDLERFIGFLKAI